MQFLGLESKHGVGRVVIIGGTALVLGLVLALGYSLLRTHQLGPIGTGTIEVTTPIMLQTVTLSKSWQNDDVGTVTVTTIQDPGPPVETLEALKARHKAGITAALAEFPESQ